MEEKILNIKHFFSVQENNKPVIARDYIQWLFNCDGYKGEVIRFIDFGTLVDFEQYDHTIYIKTIHIDNPTGSFSYFLKYDYNFPNELIIRTESGKKESVKSIDKFLKLAKERGVRVIVEDVGKCTYGNKEQLISKITE